MELTYTVELKDWDNIDSYPCVYTGSSLIQAMGTFKEYHLKGEDVIMFTEDEEGNTLEVLENYGEVSNIIKCNELFPAEDKELQKQHKEAIQQKEIYNKMYMEQINKLDQLKKENERLQTELRQLKHQLNKINDKKENNVHWYEYKLRGFSPFCQPKGHIKHDESKGKWGIIAYNRELSKDELYEYDLMPYKAV